MYFAFKKIDIMMTMMTNIYFCRSFYIKPSDCEAKLLLVQCEAADENTELLDSVRFILQREKEVTEDIVHTILLLNLPRGRNFTGYQGLCCYRI